MAHRQMMAAREEASSHWSRRADWLRKLTPALLVIAGLIWRLVSSHAKFLNADEAMHYLLASERSWTGAYRASLGTAHPPLLILTLHYWMRISSRELFLRLPSVLAGTASGWFLYAWLRLVGDRATALIAMALLLFSPALIYTSAEVRQYALALGLMSVALYLLEKALIANSAVLMLASAVSLYLALLAHYSALIFAASVAVYGLLRIASRRFRLPLIAMWMFTQAGAAGIVAFLWKTHIALIRQRALIQDVAESYLRSSLFHPRQENVFVFLVRSNLRLFHFLFSQGAVAAAGMLLFGAGIVLLFRGKALPSRGASSRQVAILLVLPFVINCAAALAGIYPYGGTRHNCYLALFTMPAVAVAIARWRTSSAWTKPLAVAAALAICNFTVTPAGAYLKPKNQKKELMDHAVRYLRATAPPGSILLTDYESGLLVSYYVCHQDITHPGVPVGLFCRSSCGVYESRSLLPRLWVFRADSFAQQLEALTETLPPANRRQIWLFQAGFIVDREPEFQALLSRYGCATPEKFGANILLCRLELPAQPAGIREAGVIGD